LPANDNDLETGYSGTDYTDVASNNAIRVAQVTDTGKPYTIHQFKDYVGSNNSCTLTWDGQSDLAPSLSTVYLQIYNRNTSTWVEVDSDNLAAANTDFILTATIADLTNYKDVNSVISCRVYQQAV
jgi:hypothetical protein